MAEIAEALREELAWSGMTEEEILTWRTKDGRLLKIEEMTTKHLRNTIIMLKKADPSDPRIPIMHGVLTTKEYLRSKESLKRIHPVNIHEAFNI